MSNGRMNQIYPIVAVNAIIFDADERVLLTQRMDNGLWCLPGGLVEFGETVERALARELDEETGIQLTTSRLTGVYSSNNVTVAQTARRCSVILAFRCEIDGQEPGTSEEVRAVKYFDLGALPQNLVENQEIRIRDAAHGSAVPFVR